MSIKTKDQKILWARSAGMCSHCRAKLSIDVDDGYDAATVGAMCHIVGEKEGSARHDSNLTPDERDSYSNLILMCSHHHDIIDKDEKEYTIEKLHILKSNHERWVSETLGDQDPDPDEMVYSDLIDTITIVLKLEEWPCFIDQAVRDIIHQDFLGSLGVLNRKLLGTIWPDKKPELKTAIIELLEAFDCFMKNYLSNVELRDSHYGPDITYKRITYNQDYEKYREHNDRWSNINFWLLCDYTNKLNNYASVVRRFSNQLYFRIAGKFLIEDSLGCRFDGVSTIFDPVDADIVNELAKLGYKTT